MMWQLTTAQALVWLVLVAAMTALALALLG
jgi:hypothetical protein